MSKTILLVLSSAVALAGCATQSVQTGTNTFAAGVGTAATAPLDDFNLRRQEIPEVLIEARGNAYATSGMTQCRAIGAEITRLDDALGLDFDQPTPSGGESDRDSQLADGAANLALGAVRDTATDFIPLRSWVRKLSGAEQHSREVQAAIRAGLVRRAFLKGIGMQKNCAPPAAPYGFAPAGRRGR